MTERGGTIAALLPAVRWRVPPPSASRRVPWVVTIAPHRMSGGVDGDRFLVGEAELEVGGHLEVEIAVAVRAVDRWVDGEVVGRGGRVHLGRHHRPRGGLAHRVR